MTDPKQLREYLLGLITDETRREHFEMLLMSDDEFLEALLVEEDELIDDLVDGTLTADERRAFEANFTVTPERLKKIEFAKTVHSRLGSIAPKQQTEAEARPGLWERIRAFVGMHRLGTATALGLVLFGCLFAVWTLFLRPSDESPILASLNRAFQNERPVNARISGLDYAPFSERRGPKSIVTDENALRRAENISRDAVFESETGENLHDLGKLQIAKREFAEAKKTLEKALAKKPDDPAILNELGIAELIAADNATSGGEQLRLVATALEHFDKAVRLSPTFAEAWFNRALAIGELNVPNQEAAAWRDYLNIDSTSKWADEARSRLSQLESQSVVPITAAELVEEFLAAYRQRDDETAFRRLSENKEMITGKLVFQQLAFLFTNAEPNSDRSKELLSAMQYAAELELKKTGDKFWKHLADYYTRNGAANRPQLKIAQDEVRAAYADTLANQYESAKPRFETAKKIFDETRNDGESMIMDYWIAYLDQQASRLNSSRTRLRIVLPIAEKKDFAWLASQYLAWLGLLAFFDDDPTASIQIYTTALAIADRNFDEYQKKRLYDSLAYSNLYLGSIDKAMQLVSLGLNINDSRSISGRQHWRTLDKATDLLAKTRLFSAAYVLLSEALDLNRRQLGEASYEYLSLLKLGRVEAARGNFEQALGYFEQSRAALPLLNQETTERHAAYLDLFTGHALREAGHCDAANPLYERAALHIDASETKVDRFDNHRGLLLCHIANHNDAKVGVETSIVLDQLDTYRELIRTESKLNSFFGGVQEVYDALIGFELARGNDPKALEYSEMSRSRSLLDMLSQPVVTENSENTTELKLSQSVERPIPIDVIRSGLSSDVQLLIYSVLPGQIAIWVVSQKQVQSVRVVIDDARLGTLIRNHTSSMSSPGTFARSDKSVGKSITSLLIEPVRKFLNPKGLIVVIPDKSLSKLPFASLPSIDGEGFLATEFIFQYAPSATVFAMASQALKLKATGSNENLLAVGNTEFDRITFPYPDLTGAKREVNEIGKLYASSSVLSGREATVTATRKYMGQADVFHFAGHYVFDAASPLRSGMLLTGRGEESMMRNSSIAVKKFKRLRLAVLSACTTGSEQIIDGEGMIGAARLFLASGVPQVVASHWEVDSDVTADLMIDFHRYRRSTGLSTARSLQEAQLLMINNLDPRRRDPYYWAPFAAFGA